MKKKEKVALLEMLELLGNQEYVDEIKKYIESCTPDFHNNKLTAKERNTRWALGQKKVLELLDMQPGESRIILDSECPRGTVSCVKTYVYPERKYKILKVNNKSYLLARVI